MQNKRIYGFDAIRAVSVLLVIVSHVGVIENATNASLIAFFSVFNASFGVRCFFVLSGFLITTLLIREYEGTGSIDVRAFMIRRALRILPLYFLVLLWLWPYFYLGRIWQPLETAAYAAFFIYNFIPNELNVHYLAHLWSLGVEEQFYIVWPFLFSLLAARRNVLVGICFAIVAVCAWRLEVGYGPSSETHTPGRWTIPAIYPIALGASLALMMGDRKVGSNVSTAIKSPLNLLIAAALIGLPLFWMRHLSGSILQISGAVGITLLVGWIYTNQQRASVRILEWKPLAYIGAISYGLYMWQGVFTGNGPYRQLSIWPPEPWLGALMTFPVAILSYHFFEQPILRMRSWLAPRMRPAE